MRRTGLVVLVLVVALAGSIGVISFFQSRDSSQLDSAEGPGVPAPEETDARLRLGNVVLTYRADGDGRRLRAIAQEASGPADASLVDAGQAVIVERDAGQADAVVAHAYKRRLAGNPADADLRRFVEFWLGRPAPDEG